MKDEMMPADSSRRHGSVPHCSSLPRQVLSRGRNPADSITWTPACAGVTNFIGDSLGTLGNNSPELSALFSSYVRWRTDWRGRKRRMRRAWVSPIIETTGAARIAAFSVLLAT